MKPMYKTLVAFSHLSPDYIFQSLYLSPLSQDWLTEAARLLSAFTAVEWVTPMGFPVIQAYYKKVEKKDLGNPFKPNIMKQKNAFPPNYIHSLDSTHMMLTSLYCMQSVLVADIS